MGHDWILDVLTDLKAFARANDMTALATQLDEAKLVAQVEIASKARGSGFGIHGDDALDGRAIRAVGIG